MSNLGKKLRFKISVIGDGKVGKTSLIKNYTQGTFETDYIETIGAQFSKYDKDIKGEVCPNIWLNSRTRVDIYVSNLRDWYPHPFKDTLKLVYFV
jgi:GTPase SAR1 family protein